MSHPYIQNFNFTVPAGVTACRFYLDVWTYIDDEPSEITTKLILDGTTTLCETVFPGNWNSGSTDSYLMNDTIWEERRLAGKLWRNGVQGGGYAAPPKVQTVACGEGNHTLQISISSTGYSRAFCVKDFYIAVAKV